MSTEEARRLLEQALRLAPELRAAIASSLLDSLDEAVDPAAEAEWAREIERRMRELDAGSTETVPWSVVRQRLLGKT